MNEPTPCPKCKEVVELDDMELCVGCDELVCYDCFDPKPGMCPACSCEHYPTFEDEIRLQMEKP